MTLPDQLRKIAAQFRRCADPALKQLGKEQASILEDAAALLDSDAYRAPVPELKGTAPLIVYFGNDRDRDEFAALVKAANPNLRSRNL